MTKVAEFELGTYESIVEFNIDTDADDVQFKLWTSMDYYLGDGLFSQEAKNILLENNDLEKYLIEHNGNGSKLKVRVVIETIDEDVEDNDI